MRRIARFLVAGGVLGAMVVAAPWYGHAQELSAVAIVTRMMERNAERQAMLQHYASDRLYQLHYSGAGGDHHAEMLVHVEYAAPGRKQFTVVQETGSKVLCKEVLHKLVDGERATAAKQDWQRTMFSPDTYNLQLLGRDDVEGLGAWVLQVSPKGDSKVGYRGRVWISTEDFAMMRVQAEPAENPSWLLDHAKFDTRYMRREGVWVPESSVSSTHLRFGGTAQVTISYGDYRTMTVAPLSTVLALRNEEDALAVATPARGAGKRGGKNTLR